MGLFKAINKWDSTAQAVVATDQGLIELQAKRMRLLFEALEKLGFTEDQAVQIVSGVKT